MRHIPDEELHAYLDQALSRSQCIEIEKHLARCDACAALRDAIAALRDRTTALLDRVAPLTRARPPFEVLLGRAAVRRESPLRRYGLWAASLAGAVLVGWGVRAVVAPAATEVAAVVESVTAPAPVPQELALAEVETAPATANVMPVPPLAPDRGRFADTEVQLAGRGPSAPEPVPAVPPPPTDAGGRLLLDGSWGSLSLAEAEEATGRLVPMLSDLPVAEIRFRQAAASQRPLLMVSQRHPTAGMIHTLEGPVADLARLVGAIVHPESGVRSSDPSRSLPDYLETAGTYRRTSRVLVVIGRLPVDSLNALAQAVVMR